MFVKCPCQHCDGKIEFDSEYSGTSVKCPHCFEPTVLIAPPEQIAMANKPHSQTQFPAGEWMKDPISPKQKAMLVLYGVNFTEGLTKGEAAKLIDDAKQSLVVPTEFQKQAAAKLFAEAEMHHVIDATQRAADLLGAYNCTIKELQFAKKKVKESLATFTDKIDYRIEEIRLNKVRTYIDKSDDIPM